MKTFSKTDIGRKREVNQDYVFVSDQPVGNIPNLLIVADGMGGHNAGDYASKFVVEVLKKELAKSREDGPRAMMKKAIASANHQLIAESKTDARLEGMGTTLVAATVIEHTLYFANVGDSRLYLLNDEIRQLSKDHSLVQEMVRLGGLNAEEAKHHPDKNIITRAIGVKEDVEIDFFEHRLKKGDIILMCTDGLSNMVEDEEIFQIVRSSRDVVEAVEQLIERANNDIKKSIELSDKSKYYEEKAKSAENNNAIYNDDPEAIQKLKNKLKRLENERTIIKGREHSSWELSNIGANIRETKLRIQRLEEQENLEFPDVEFKGGKVIHNKEINRIQIIFDDIPNENIRSELKHNGFHWSRYEGAWQRQFNQRTIYVTKSLIKDVLNNEKESEDAEEFE